MSSETSHPSLDANSSAFEEFVEHAPFLVSGFARLSTSLMTFASSSEVSDFMVTGFFGHISGLRSHAEPFYQSSASVTWLP